MHRYALRVPTVPKGAHPAAHLQFLARGQHCGLRLGERCLGLHLLLRLRRRRRSGRRCRVRRRRRTGNRARPVSDGLAHGGSAHRITGGTRARVGRGARPAWQPTGVRSAAADGPERMHDCTCSTRCAASSVSGWSLPSTRRRTASAARSISSASACSPWAERDIARLFALVTAPDAGASSLWLELRPRPRPRPLPLSCSSPSCAAADDAWPPPGDSAL